MTGVGVTLAGGTGIEGTLSGAGSGVGSISGITFKAVGTLSSTTDTSLTVTLPAFTAGDFCVVAVATTDVTTADFGAAPTGWTKEAEGEGNVVRNNCAIYWRRLQVGDSNPTIGFGASALLVGFALTFTGVNVASPMDTTSSGQFSNANSFTPTGLSATTGASMQVVADAGYALTVTNANGYDLRANNTNLIVMTKLASAAGVVSCPTFNDSGGGRHAAAIIMLRAA